MARVERCGREAEICGCSCNFDCHGSVGEHQYSVVWFVQKVLPLDIQPSLAHEGREFSVHSTWSQLLAFDEVLFSFTV